MMKLIDIGIDNAVAIRISGKITQSDMALLLSEMKGKIRAYGHIVMFEQIDSFEGVELAGLAEKIKYLSEMGVSSISKVAIVTDKHWLSNIVSVEDKLFQKIEMQSFPFEERERAIAFLKSTDSNFAEGLDNA